MVSLQTILIEHNHLVSVRLSKSKKHIKVVRHCIFYIVIYKKSEEGSWTTYVREASTEMVAIVRRMVHRDDRRLKPVQRRVHLPPAGRRCDHDQKVHAREINQSLETYNVWRSKRRSAYPVASFG